MTATILNITGLSCNMLGAIIAAFCGGRYLRLVDTSIGMLETTIDSYLNPGARDVLLVRGLNKHRETEMRRSKTFVSVGFFFIAVGFLLQVVALVMPTDHSNPDLTQAQIPTNAMAFHSAAINSQAASNQAQEQATFGGHPTPISDPAARLKASLAGFASAYGAVTNKGPGKWAVASYDIRKTDSVVSPLIALVHISQDLPWGPKNPDIAERYDVVLVLQDDGWVLKSLTDVNCYKGKDTTTIETHFSDPSDPIFDFAQFLRGYLK